MSKPKRNVTAGESTGGGWLPDSSVAALAVLLCENETLKRDVTREELERAGEWPCVACKRRAEWLVARGVQVGAPGPREPQEDAQVLRLLRHLRNVQSEDGCDLIGQETNELMWWVARHFGFRTVMVQHEPAPDCSFVGPHNFSECGSDVGNLDFEVNPDTLAAARGPEATPAGSWDDVAQVLEGFEKGIFQRNADGDGASDWAVKLLPYVAALSRLYEWAGRVAADRGTR